MSRVTLTGSEEHIESSLNELVLEGKIENPVTVVSLLPVLAEVECHQLLVESHGTAEHYPAEQCIHELVETQLARDPGAVAIEFSDVSLTDQ